LVLRFFGQDGDRLLLINLDVGTTFDPAPEPLIAPPQGTSWKALWSSEHPAYGGRGILSIVEEGEWRLQGFAALVLASKKA
jgi:maltooligosyltrehalose trehalohydrolase